MNINWKEVSRSPGYRSLKAAYIYDVQYSEKRKQKGFHPMREKAEFRKLFNWIIQRAVHYHLNSPLSLIAILNKWETERGRSWWFGYYQNSRQPKIHSNSLKSMGVNGRVKWRTRTCDQQERKRLRVQELKTWDKQRSTKDPKRWSADRKRRGY
jgi:hypothetical protein